jgi:hypothetical protein
MDYVSHGIAEVRKSLPPPLGGSPHGGRGSTYTKGEDVRRVHPARTRRYSRSPADVAQLVEHFTRNEGVPGSSPGVGFLDLQAFSARAAR